MDSSEGVALRQAALEALEKSTKLLKVAVDLISKGSEFEAERLRSEARTHRTISTLLMTKANNLEMDVLADSNEAAARSSSHVPIKTRSRANASAE